MKVSIIRYGILCFWISLLFWGCNTSAVLSEVQEPPVPVVEPYLSMVLGRPTDTSIAVNIQAEVGTEVYLEYGMATTAYTARTNSITFSAATPMVIEITGLQANRRYYYRGVYRAQGENTYYADQEYTFQTQRVKGSTFSFGVQGDSHPEREDKMYHPDLYTLNMQNVAVQQPDFYFALGDDFSIESLIDNNQLSQANVNAVYANQRNFFSIIGNATAVFLINGNHEQAAGYLLGAAYQTQYVNAPIFAGYARLMYFPLPSPDNFYSGDTTTVTGVGLLRDYYAWEWGDALFVTIDPYWHSPVPVDTGVPGVQKTKNAWEISIGDEQYLWLKNTLEESNTKYKFIFEHHVLGTGRGAAGIAHTYEWGGYDKSGKAYEFNQERPNWPKPVHQLLKENHVTIFFAGHDHLFAREQVDGIVYQSVPNPADNTYQAFNSDAYAPTSIAFPGASYDPGYSVVLSNSGYLHVTVSPENVKVDYIRAVLPGDELKAGGSNGTVAFSYTITTN